MDALLHPRSITIIGASTDPRKVSGRPLKYLLKHAYPGAIYPVNSTAVTVQGVRAFPSLESLPETPDLAIICLPAAAVPNVLRACRARSIRAVTILTSGFAEAGGDGVRLQEEVTEIAREGAMAVCGPNSVGIINVWERVAASFSAHLEQDMLPGPIAFISQSGAMGTTLYNRMQDEGLGFSYFISTGNEAVLESLDYAEAILRDERTRVVAAYIEGFRNGRKLFRVGDLARQLGKQVVVLKVGRTEPGRRAALSHTAAVTGSHEVYQAAFKQAGIIQVRDVEDLVDACRLLSGGLSLPGRRLAILTGSGGAGVLATDHLIEEGFEVPALSGSVRESLQRVLPPFAACNNPVDVTAQIFAEPGLLRRSLEIVAAEHDVDAIVVVLTMAPPETARQVAEDVRQVAGSSEKPVAVCWLAGSLVDEGRKLLKKAGIPLYNALPSLSAGLRVLLQAGGVKRVRPEVERNRGGLLLPAALRAALEEGGLLPYRRARDLLNFVGISGPREALVQSPDEAAEEARRLGLPVALKLISPRLAHKSEAGGVRLGLATPEAVETAARDLLTLAERRVSGAVEGLLVQEMVMGGVEVLVGTLHDRQFGVVLGFGLGGILVEVLRAVCHRFPPLSADDAESMIDEIPGAQILDGYRGQPRRDRRALIEAIIRLSALSEIAGPLIAELDINPLLVLEEGRGVVALDVRVVGRGAPAGFA